MLDLILEVLCAFGPAAAFFTVLAVQCSGDSRPQHAQSKSGSKKGKKSHSGKHSVKESSKSRSGKRRSSQGSTSGKGAKSKSGRSSKSKSGKSKSRSSSKGAHRKHQSGTSSNKSSKQSASRSANTSRRELVADSYNDGADSKKDLRMEPVELRWGVKGGVQKVFIRNPTKERHAIKVKCSDNNLYRVNPVYSFVEPGQVLSVDVLRQLGEPKVDKMVFVTSKANARDAQPRDLFESAEAKPMMVLPLIAVNE